MIYDPGSGSVFQLWSTIHNPNHFQYNPKHFGSNYQFSDDNIADLGSFFRIGIIFADRASFCGSWIVWCSRKMIRKMIWQQNGFDRIHFIWSMIRITSGSIIRDLQSGSFFRRSSPFLLKPTVNFHIAELPYGCLTFPEAATYNSPGYCSYQNNSPFLTQTGNASVDGLSIKATKF